MKPESAHEPYFQVVVFAAPDDPHDLAEALSIKWA
jgi:hypothetical protein